MNLMIDEIGRKDVPCGKCIYCLNSKRNDWSFRLYQEQKQSTSAVFITLTYTDENLTWGASAPTLVKQDFQLFMKRLRKHNEKWKTKIRYYAVGEYGTETQRPHYHAMLFNTHANVLNKLTDIWKLGATHIGECNPATIRYLTKYVINNAQKHQDKLPQFSLMSRKPGIGENYLKHNANYHKATSNLHVINDVGGFQTLPRFYQDKIWTPGEKATIKHEKQRKAEKKRWEQIDSYYAKDKNYFKAEVEHNETKISRMAKELNKKNTL